MKTIDEQVFDGIRKTINRFREKPFYYFTEADIHSSLLNDIMTGGDGIISDRKDIPVSDEEKINISISFVHQEYPTHFRYKKEQLLDGYGSDKNFIIEHTHVDSNHGDRGNYDLSIINPVFVDEMCKEKIDKQNGRNKKYDLLPLKHIINKDIELTREHKSEELLYAIEVKFLHIFNASNSDMLKEVIKDNEKLRLTHIHTNGKTKCINLVFCSAKGYKRRVADEKEEDSVPDRIKEYIKGENQIKLYNSKNEVPKPDDPILNIFIESYLDLIDEKKKTIKPTTNFDNTNSKLDWAQDLIKKLHL